MKKIKAFAGKVARIPLPVLCYSMVIIIWLIVCTTGLVMDTAAKNSGSLVQQNLAPKDFRLVDMAILEDGAVVSTTDDPQMILDDVDGAMRSFRFWADFSGEGYEMSLYYATEGMEEFDKDMRAWPVQMDDGSYYFELPRKDIKRLRLDPVSVPGLRLDFHEMVLNEPATALSYYNPGWAGLFMLVFLPGLLAAVLRWGIDMFVHYRRYFQNRRGGKTDAKLEAKQKEGAQ